MISFTFGLRNFGIMQIWNGWSVWHQSSKDCMTDHLYLHLYLRLYVGLPYFCLYTSVYVIHNLCVNLHLCWCPTNKGCPIDKGCWCLCVCVCVNTYEFITMAFKSLSLHKHSTLIDPWLFILMDWHSKIL